MEKTAVEWLEEKIKANPFRIENDRLWNKAKEMEKEQIIDAAMWLPEPFNTIEFIPELAKQYYKNKYGNM
jgi:hypothetical protein